MVITIELPDGSKAQATLPYDGADHVVTTLPCPHCKAEPLKARVDGSVQRAHDTYTTATTVTLCCEKKLGPMVAKVSTIFGIEEDERVLNGRCRVY
jgi:deoxycytidylate deaminase